jgi:chromosome segregation ATPase
MTDIVERLRDCSHVSRAVLEAADEIERLRNALTYSVERLGSRFNELRAMKLEHAEILQAHTALVARLHDVTTQLEAERAAHEDQMVSAMHEIDMLRSERDEERARIAGAPVGTARFDAHEWLTLDDADLDESSDGQRFALVVLDKVTP